MNLFLSLLGRSYAVSATLFQLEEALLAIFYALLCEPLRSDDFQFPHSVLSSVLG
jgi:hypothetical protein